MAGITGAGADSAVIVSSTAIEIRITPVQGKAARTVEGERKTVTALFADIKGSMKLMENLDPEAAGAIVDPALKLMIDAGHLMTATNNHLERKSSRTASVEWMAALDGSVKLFVL